MIDTWLSTANRMAWARLARVPAVDSDESAPEEFLIP